MALRTIPIRRAGNRHNLFLGGDRELVMLAGLLAFGAVLTVASAPHAPQSWLALGLAALLAAVYLAGTLAEKRHSTAGAGPDPARDSPWWLAAVTLLWVALVTISGDFAWLAFPLFFLHLHVLRTAHAVFAVAVLTGVVIASQWWHNGGLEPAMLIGPVVGAVFVSTARPWTDATGTS